jgi:hypothetical protein
MLVVFWGVWKSWMLVEEGGKGKSSCPIRSGKNQMMLMMQLLKNQIVLKMRLLEPLILGRARWLLLQLLLQLLQPHLLLQLLQPHLLLQLQLSSPRPFLTCNHCAPPLPLEKLEFPPKNQLQLQKLRPLPLPLPQDQQKLTNHLQVLPLHQNLLSKSALLFQPHLQQHQQQWHQQQQQQWHPQ